MFPVPDPVSPLDFNVAPHKSLSFSGNASLLLQLSTAYILPFFFFLFILSFLPPFLHSFFPSFFSSFLFLFKLQVTWNSLNFTADILVFCIFVSYLERTMPKSIWFKVCYFYSVNICFLNEPCTYRNTICYITNGVRRYFLYPHIHIATYSWKYLFTILYPKPSSRYWKCNREQSKGKIKQQSQWTKI